MPAPAAAVLSHARSRAFTGLCRDVLMFCNEGTDSTWPRSCGLIRANSSATIFTNSGPSSTPSSRICIASAHFGGDAAAVQPGQACR